MALYLGKKKVAPSIQVKVPSMKAYFDAGGKCASSSATSFEGIIKYEDTSNVTDMTNMFKNCTSLTSIPQLNTSNVTNMYGMFYECLKLKSVPLSNTSKVTNMHSIFYYCKSLTAIPQLDTSKVTDMFNAFQLCSNLTTIPQLDVSNATDLGNIFDYCQSLTEIHMYGMKTNFAINASTKFTREALVEILNNLATVTSTKRLTMGSTNLAKLTDEDKAIATGKGWTLA